MSFKIHWNSQFWKSFLDKIKTLITILKTNLNIVFCRLNRLHTQCLPFMNLSPYWNLVLMTWVTTLGFGPWRRHTPALTNVLRTSDINTLDSHEQLILKMFVNTRVLCVLLKPGADKCNHYSIIFSFCTISFKILTCHLCLTSEATAHADEIQPLKPEIHRSLNVRGSKAWFLAQPGSFVTLCEKQTDDLVKWFFRAIFGMARSWQRKCNHAVFW